MPARETSLRGGPAILFGGLFMGRFGGGKASPVAPETASREAIGRAGWWSPPALECVSKLANYTPMS